RNSSPSQQPPQRHGTGKAVSANEAAAGSSVQHAARRLSLGEDTGVITLTRRGSGAMPLLQCLLNALKRGYTQPDHHSRKEQQSQEKIPALAAGEFTKAHPRRIHSVHLSRPWRLIPIDAITAEKRLMRNISELSSAIICSGSFSENHRSTPPNPHEAIFQAEHADRFRLAAERHRIPGRSHHESH